MDEISTRILRYDRLIWSAVWRFRRRSMSQRERCQVSADELYAAALVPVWKILRGTDEPDGRELGVLVFIGAKSGCRDWLQHVGLRLNHRAVRLRFGGERAVGLVTDLVVNHRRGSVCGVARVRRRRGRAGVPC